MQDCIYEAQQSLIILGVDDFFWTAYFCGDSYFTGRNPVHGHLDDKTDGPAGGLRQCNRPIWDPRYYFLVVLSTRINQVTMEWTALVQFMEIYLDPHVSRLQCLRNVPNTPIIGRDKPRKPPQVPRRRPSPKANKGVYMDPLYPAPSAQLACKAHIRVERIRTEPRRLLRPRCRRRFARPLSRARFSYPQEHRRARCSTYDPGTEDRDARENVQPCNCPGPQFREIGRTDSRSW